MARTKSRKALLQAQRQGGWSPVMNRRTNGDYADISQHVRVKPDKQAQLNKAMRKERITYDDAPFCCPDFLLRLTDRFPVTGRRYAVSAAEEPEEVGIICESAGLRHLLQRHRAVHHPLLRHFQPYLIRILNNG